MFVFALGLTALVGCKNGKPKPGDAPFGVPCDEDKDCQSLVCAAMEGDTRICTEVCTDPLGDECEDGFKCRRPNREEQMVCVCTDPRGCEVDDPTPPEECTSDDECDDDVSCTVDVCEVDECTHNIDPTQCEVGWSCDPGAGCVENEECDEDRDCAITGDPCRQFGFCDASSGRCQYEIIDNDGDGAYPEECGGNDCDDFDFNVAGGLPDICDEINNDCDSRVDEDAVSKCGGMSCSFGDCMCVGSEVDCSEWGQGCVDVFSDPNNCGGCGFVCEPGFNCDSGECRDVNECTLGTQCPPHSTCTNVPGRVECRCDFGFEPNDSKQECIDVNECRRGFHNCGSETNCVNLFGGFECDCAAGFEDLGMGCQDINECRTFSCGRGVCRNTAGGFFCECNFGYAPGADGSCVLVDECQAGVLTDLRWCDGACRDLRNDSSYCGSCFNECIGSTFCDDGACACDNAALTYCDGTCVNTKNDEANCGYCNNVCPEDATCVNGTCTCPMGEQNCGDSCQVLGTPQNCLSCFNECPIGAMCTDEGCECPASAPSQCDGVCVNTNTHEQHCGGCYRYCPEDAMCTNGQCDCPNDAPNFCFNSNTCNDFETSEYACGGCDQYCPAICNGGSCAQAEQIALGGTMGCILFSDGRVGCFGSNESGRLGRGISASLTGQELGVLSLTNVVQIAARDGHACAIRSNDALHCWGENSSEQLGNGNTTDQTSPVLTREGVEQVAVGLSHTCVLLPSSGKVECTGSDALGQRGDGDDVADAGTWTGPAMLEGFDKLVSGQNHLCGLRSGEVFCWGDNASGQLGTGTIGGTSNAPSTKVTGLSGVTDIAAGRAHTCAITGRDVYCWGENGSSQVGTDTTTDRSVPVALGFANATQIAAGDAHTCVLTEGGTVWCWGSGSDRQNGATMTGPELRGIYGPWVYLAAGSAHTCTITSEGDFYCWGDGAAIAYLIDIAEPVRIIR